jgi:hypothetical protein
LHLSSDLGLVRDGTGATAADRIRAQRGTEGERRRLARDVRREDVQSLSNADQVAAFFSVLGYQTDARVPQTAANLGITAESLGRQITRLERLADQEGLLQVYLCELSSVTVAVTRALAAALRNRAGNYLLILTHDYERPAARWADKREAEVRKSLLEPTLQALGFALEKVKGSHDDRPDPDYLLRAGNGAGSPLAVCLTYRYADELRDAASTALEKEAVLVVVMAVYHVD